MVRQEIRDGRVFTVTVLPDDPALGEPVPSTFRKHRKRGKKRPRKGRKR